MKISIVSDDTRETFPLVAVTNLDFAKMLHIGKGEIIGFARPETDEVMYIATTNEIGMDPYVDNAPRNWIPPRKRKTLQQPEKQCDTFGSSRNSIQCSSAESRLQHSDDRLRDESRKLSPQQHIHADMMKVKAKELLSKKAKE